MIDRMNRRMCLIIISATSRLSETAIVEVLRESAPALIARLFLDDCFKIHAAIELICLSARVANPTFIVEIFGNLQLVSLSCSTRASP